MVLVKEIVKIIKKSKPSLLNEEGESRSDHRMGLRMQLTAFLNATLGIILLIIALCTDHWCGRESDMLTIYEGLWTKCTDHHHEGGRPKFCTKLEGTFGHDQYNYYPVLVFLFLACFVHLISFVMSIVLLCQRQNMKLEKALAIVQFIVLLLTVVGLVFYVITYDDNYYGLKWSCALGWGSTLCFLAALVFLLIDIDRQNKTADNN
ncbi:transmembrane protein 47-like isoform X1 [Clytia hemisphaerica]|uniref:Uncharacterized protein n=1 Tax=Clytia hemisphaerica TaxID=252671 RepID=A0A7M5TWI2_9CNID